VQIKKLEIARAALPTEEDFDAQRSSIDEKIESIKASIKEQQPIGARIDAARAALERSQARRAEAEKAHRLAEQCLQQASEEVDTYAKSLQELEAALAATPMEEDPPDMLASLKGKLDEVLQTLSASGFADPQHIQHASRHVEQHLSGLSATQAHADEVRRASSNVRMSSKQPPKSAPEPPTEPAPFTRYVGKQPAKRVLSDFFAKTPESKRPACAPGLKPTPAASVQNSFSPLAEEEGGMI